MQTEHRTYGANTPHGGAEHCSASMAKAEPGKLEALVAQKEAIRLDVGDKSKQLLSAGPSGKANRQRAKNDLLLRTVRCVAPGAGMSRQRPPARRRDLSFSK